MIKANFHCKANKIPIIKNKINIKDTYSLILATC